ncbi:hypothetical protein L345_17966, partial [Ophiophagus hannah]
MKRERTGRGKERKKERKRAEIGRKEGRKEGKREREKETETERERESRDSEGRKEKKEGRRRAAAAAEAEPASIRLPAGCLSSPWNSLLFAFLYWFGVKLRLWQQNVERMRPERIDLLSQG